MSSGQTAVPARDRNPKPRSDAQYLEAVSDFDTAVRHFQKQKYDKAKEIFEKLAAGPVLEVAARARVHVRLCDQKLQAASTVAPKSVEDYYDLGLFELNAGHPETALEYLSKADKMAPRQEHILYALAAAHARQGNTEAALTHLSQAVTLRPENRVHARRDEDFQSLTAEPRFRKLVG